jgi:hypothetical protein
MSEDFTEQALDIFLENDTLHKKVIEPIKRKVYPYVISILLFNVILFLMLAYLTHRVYLLQL